MASGAADILVRQIRKLVGARRSDPGSDRELLQRYAGQCDEAAFETLVRRHGPMVFRVCQRSLGNVHDAEDVFQATFLVLACKAASLRWRESVGPWLHEVAYRLARDAKTAAARRRAQEGRAAERQSVDPLALLTVREAQLVLDEELARLPEKYRAPLVLCCLEGMARDEAAQQARLDPRPPQEPAGASAASVARATGPPRVDHSGCAGRHSSWGRVPARPPCQPWCFVPPSRPQHCSPRALRLLPACCRHRSQLY